MVGANGTVCRRRAERWATGGDPAPAADRLEFQRLNSSLQRMVDSASAPATRSCTITADLDFDQTETKTETYVADPGGPAADRDHDQGDVHRQRHRGRRRARPGQHPGPNARTAPASTSHNGHHEQRGRPGHRDPQVGARRGQKLSVAVLLDSNTVRGRRRGPAAAAGHVGGRPGRQARRHHRRRAMAFDKTGPRLPRRSWTRRRRRRSRPPRCADQDRRAALRCGRPVPMAFIGGRAPAEEVQRRSSRRRSTLSRPSRPSWRPLRRAVPAPSAPAARRASCGGPAGGLDPEVLAREALA